MSLKRLMPRRTKAPAEAAARVKSALIIGGSGSALAEAEEAMALGRYDLTIAINDVGTLWSGPIDIWCSLHPDKMAGWREARARAGYPAASRHIGHVAAPGVDEGREYRFAGQPSSGSSGLFAVKIAIDDGCERIVLAGVPMSPELGHHNDGKPWDECNVYLPAWEWAMPIMRDKVRSMSGWTAEKLGRPDADWLNGAA
jgi:hypothetical protein